MTTILYDYIFEIIRRPITTLIILTFGILIFSMAQFSSSPAVVSFPYYGDMSFFELTGIAYILLGIFSGIIQIKRARKHNLKATLNLVDTYIINCIYMFSLSIICGSLLYVLIVALNLDQRLSLLALLAYLIIEISWLFYGKAVQTGIPELNPWHSYSLGIWVSSLITFPYLAFRLRDRAFFEWSTRSVFAIIIDRVMNPNWLQPSSSEELRINRRRGSGVSNLERVSACLSAIYRYIFPNPYPNE
jgi:hypothetical protein